MAGLRAELEKVAVTDPSKLTATCEAIVKATAAIPKFTSGDTKQIISGALDLVSSFAPLCGPCGVAVGAAALVVNGILGLFGGGADGASMADVVGSVIRDALDEARLRELQADVNGIKREFGVSQSFLNGIRSHSLTTDELASVQTQVPVLSGVRFMGILADAISNYCAQSNLPDDHLESRARTGLRLVVLYAQLACLRDQLLFNLYTTTESCSKNIAGGIWQVRIHELKEDKKVLRFLCQPDPKQLMVVSLYRSQHETFKHLGDFIHEVGLKIESPNPESDKLYNLLTEKWKSSFYPFLWKSNYFGTNKYPVAASGGENHYPGPQAEFKFETLGDGYFMIKSRQWKEWYVYVSNTKEGWLYGWKGDPGAQGHFTLVQMSNKKYAICTKKWPTHFVYMNDWSGHYLRVCGGDPGPQGYWDLTENEPF